MAGDLPQSDAVVDRMTVAPERVKRRLLLATAALDSRDIQHAVIEDNAVAAWVATVDEAAVRNTQDVDILIRRDDFDQAKAALESAGFVYRHAAGLDIFLDADHVNPRHAVHIVFANEIVRPGEPAANPDVFNSTMIGPLRVIDLKSLVQIKLTAFRDKDRTHLRDMIDIGLIDASWVSSLPPQLATRLQSLLDTPDG